MLAWRNGGWSSRRRTPYLYFCSVTQDEHHEIFPTTHAYRNKVWYGAGAVCNILARNVGIVRQACFILENRKIIPSTPTTLMPPLLRLCTAPHLQDPPPDGQ